MHIHSLSITIITQHFLFVYTLYEAHTSIYLHSPSLYEAHKSIQPHAAQTRLLIYERAL